MQTAEGEVQLDVAVPRVREMGVSPANAYVEAKYFRFPAASEPPWDDLRCVLDDADELVAASIQRFEQSGGRFKLAREGEWIALRPGDQLLSDAASPASPADASSLSLSLYLDALFHAARFAPQQIASLAQARPAARLLVLSDPASLDGLLAALDGRRALLLHLPWAAAPADASAAQLAALRDCACLFAGPAPAPRAPRFFGVTRETGCLEVASRRAGEA